MLGAMMAAVPSLAQDKTAKASDAGATRLRVAHMTDPQFGFGPGRRPEEKYASDLRRFEREIEIVNSMKPDLALITGDMTNNHKDVARDWPRLLKKFEVPVAVAPGNHDLGLNVRKDMFDGYMAVFGYDYKAFDVNGWRVIVGNTQFWHKTELKAEQARYEEWLKGELEKAKAYKGRVILAGHIPPFAHAVNEKNSYENYPKAGREERLRMYRHAGVKFYMSGHTHRMSLHGYKSLTILNAETTSSNFDARPHGFRMFDVADEYDYSYKFVNVSA